MVALSPVASDADCLSSDRSHEHGHVGELLVNIVHTLVVDHAILFNDALEEVVMQLIAFRLMSLRLGSCFFVFWFALSLLLSLPHL